MLTFKSKKIIALSVSKLMRLDRPWAKFWSKSYSNCLLINIFNPNLGVRSIFSTISIWFRSTIGQNWSILVDNWSIYIKNVFDINRRFRLINRHLVDLNRLKDRFYIKKARFNRKYNENRSILYRNRDRRLDLNRWNPNWQ